MAYEKFDTTEKNVKYAFFEAAVYKKHKVTEFACYLDSLYLMK